MIGPPGSGKTTYVGAMSELLRSLGRKVAIVNLDPANENMTYSAGVDISDLVTVEEVMDQMKPPLLSEILFCYIPQQQCFLCICAGL